MNTILQQVDFTHLKTRVICSEASIHTYFDVNPESPDGQHLCFFIFDGKPLKKGRIIISDRNGENRREICHCSATPHGAAQQGWYDNEHIYFAADGLVRIAHIDGRITKEFKGAIDTINHVSGRGLAPSVQMRKCGLDTWDGEEACYAIDFKQGKMEALLDRSTAYAMAKQYMDLSDIPEEETAFKHTKWSPDGKQWFVVFCNEHRKATRKKRLKTLIAANEDGSNLRFIGEFGHHPNWMPDGSAIFAYAKDSNNISRWDPQTCEESLLAAMPCAGHPSMHPSKPWMVTDTHQKENSTSIVLHCTDDGSNHVLYEGPDPQVDWQTMHPPHRVCHAHPVWSADGRRLYFNKVVGEMPRLCVIDFPC